MLLKLISKFVGDPNAKEIAKLQEKIAHINDLEKEYQKLTDDEFNQKTPEFRDRIAKGETLDALLPEVFAVVKNACRRIMGQKFTIGKQEQFWDMIPYDVQLIGGMVLHQGKIAEMKTGEGKTLVAALAVYLNALSGNGVYVVTVNDYLASRDAEWMGKLYQYLGMSVGVIVHGLNHDQRKEAYAADITYGTNNEYGFDYLRDNMATSQEQVVQRKLNYAIVDEVDSILIDEARTPLIISAPAEESTYKYEQYSHLVKQLQENTDYNIDEKLRAATLTEQGIAKMEKLLNVKNIYTDAGFLEVHHIEQALKAQAIFKKDIDYLIKEGEIIIVDEFTGRLMPGRRYSDGLHQAIEAKEKVEIQRESRTFATITFQNYFRLFDKLAGMTGTAATEAEEFNKIYSLDVVIIPTNQDVQRDDKADAIYKNEKGKYEAITKIVKEKNERGQPVLVGTISVEKSEILSQLFKINGIPHNVLNAKHHEKEAEIIAKAGQKGAVTIATNMAGRGTDIKLGEEVTKTGGLAILGTERHESRRIDNQLRGRSGRQGDPGESQFFVSMDDSLMRLFGSERIQRMMEKLGLPDDMPIENKMISNAIENAQKKVEGHNFDIRKHVVEYDDVMNKHREIIYAKRNKVLRNENLKEEVLEMIKTEVETFVMAHTASSEVQDWNYKEIFETVTSIYRDENLTQKDLEEMVVQEELVSFLQDLLVKAYQTREDSLPTAEILRETERSVNLRAIDVLWMEHLDAMTHLRDAVALSGYAQKDPLIAYKEEAFHLFRKLLGNIQSNVIKTLFKIEIIVNASPLPQQSPINQANLQTNTDEIESNVATSTMAQKSQPIVRRGQPTVINANQQSTVVSPKIKRNEPCPCGSGKKYKKCCGV